MSGLGGKNNWALFLLILAGVVLGGFIGEYTAGISFLSWLSYGQTFGLTSPVAIDLGILAIEFALTIRFTVAGIIGIIVAIIIYKRI